MTLNKYLSILKLVYMSLIISLISIGLVAFFVFHMSNQEVLLQSRLSKYAILAVVALAFAIWSFTGRLLKKDPGLPLRQRIQSWYIFRVVRGAVLESVGMTGIVASIITADKMYLIAPVFVAGVLVISLPSKFKLIHELELGHDEVKELATLNN